MFRGCFSAFRFLKQEAFQVPNGARFVRVGGHWQLTFIHTRYERLESDVRFEVFEEKAEQNAASLHVQLWNVIVQAVSALTNIAKRWAVHE